MENVKKVKHTGIMNKMRDKMPLIIIILIVAFLATIIFEWGMNYLGLRGQAEAFGKINNHEITYQEYEKLVQQQLDQMRQQNQGKDVTEEQVKQVREQVWNSLVSQTLTREAIDKYGIKVTDGEILDWIYNRPESLPEPIKKNFMDSTGVFNSGFYQQALNMKTKEATQFWNQVENYLRETLLSERLQAVLTEGVVVSEADVLETYKDDNIYAGIDYCLLDLNTVTDSTKFAVTDEELKKYYDEHKIDYRQDESVKLKYATFPEVASNEDSTNMMKTVERLKKDMEKATLEDSSIIKLMMENSQTSWNSDFQKSTAFELPVQNFLFKAKVGDVSNVVIGEDGYQVLKLLDVKDGNDLYCNAAHILVHIKDGDTAAAKKKADEYYNRVNNGEDIQKLALEFSDDPSVKQNNGNLGWFPKGAMVKEFENAVFNNPVNSLQGPVLTRFGFHVIKVLGKEKKEFKVAQLLKAVLPTPKSIQVAKSNAEEFYSRLKSSGKNMDTLAKEMNATIQVSGDITKDGSVPGSSDKSLVKYFFGSKVNSFSEPKKIAGGYAVFELIEKKEEGFQNFDSIKTRVLKPKLIVEKKYKILEEIAADLKGKIQNSDINSLKQIAPQYIYMSNDSLKISKPDNNIGQDFGLNRAIFNMKPGEISNPLKGSRGIFIVKLKSITEFKEEEYLKKAPDLRKSLLMTKRQMIVSDWLSKMQNEAVIIDNRSIYLN